MSSGGQPLEVRGGVLVLRAPRAEGHVTVAREVRLAVPSDEDDAVLRGHAVNVASIMPAFDLASSVDVGLVSGFPAHGVGPQPPLDLFVRPYARAVSDLAQDLLGLTGQGLDRKS